MAMKGYEIVLKNWYDDPNGEALRIYVEKPDGTREHIDLSYDAVQQLEADLGRCLYKYSRDPNN